MFNKALVVSKGNSRIDLQKNKIFGDYQNIKANIAKKEFHYTVFPKAQVITQHDYFTKSKIDLSTKMRLVSNEAKKGTEIKEAVQNTINFNNQKLFNISKNTYIRALSHYCFYDIISEDNENVTIKFLPISTSDKNVLCGLEKFNKVFVYSNGLNNFYITRILFQKTMTKEDYNKWVNNKEFQFIGDINARKIIFNEIQKDLEVHQYCLFKDSDLIDTNTSFFMNDLPKNKFKFTDFVE